MDHRGVAVSQHEEMPIFGISMHCGGDKATNVAAVGPDEVDRRTYGSAVAFGWRMSREVLGYRFPDTAHGAVKPRHAAPQLFRGSAASSLVFERRHSSKPG